MTYDNVIFVRQAITIPVKLTGKINRFAPTPNQVANNTQGDIATLEIEPQAPYWHNKTTWVNANDLMWEDGEPIYPEHLEKMCQFEADKRAVIDKIHKDISVSPAVNEIVASSLIYVARAYEYTPLDLLEEIKKAGWLGDMVSGVSVWKIFEDLEEKWLMEEGDLEKVVEEIE